ncbi:P-loop containing nucleoside triphosphate hydrolase protein [Obelidium mucronatum]|nr:P-loop containing nucleoside triphosphate hydrolase protein [Obelidium mucronatum]
MTLKSYQLVGVSWLNLLYSKGLGGILADEMGLGKTAQVIAWIIRILIIVPSSTLENWLREFANWSPSLNILSYYGSQPERENIRYNVAQGDLATYDVVLRPRSMILDEGHMVKNMQSSRYQSLNSIRAPFRLLLTEALKQIFSLKATSTSDATVLNRQRIQRAKQMMTPFVLRRKKDNVLKELPSKLRKEIFCTMTESQKVLYQSIIADCKKSLFKTEAPPSEETPAEETPPSAAKAALAAAKAKPVTGDNTNVLMQLRKAANHPLLFRRIYNNDKLKVMAREIMREEQYMEANIDYIREDMEYMSDFQLHKLCLNFKSIQHHALLNEEWMDSGKVEWLKSTLPEMIEKGDRVLIFSQFVIMLDVLESVMTTLGIKFVRLDGSTNVVDRQSLIDDFNEDPSIGVFLLSTKAGGLGLNLTSSNVVIIHDMDFNPHNDAQAEDRAHRVGQTRDVTVIKLVIAGSVEQHILKLATTKLKLDKSLQQKQADEDQEDNASGEGGAEDSGSGKKGKGKKSAKEDAAAALIEEESAPSAAEDKKLMEMLRNEWREAGDAI